MNPLKAAARCVVGASCLGLVVTAGCSDDPASDNGDPGDLVYVSPEAVGFSSEKLEAAGRFAEQIGSSAVMALYDGRVFFDWGKTTAKYSVHSIRKPFLGAIFGIHVAHGDIDLDASLEDLAIDDIPPALTAEEKQATVRDLLKSRSGVYHPAAAEAPIMEETRPGRGSHPPGTFFYYNNWDFNVLGTIFEQETGRDIFEAFRDEIAGPIGMQDFSVEGLQSQPRTTQADASGVPFQDDCQGYGSLRPALSEKWKLGGQPDRA